MDAVVKVKVKVAETAQVNKVTAKVEVKVHLRVQCQSLWLRGRLRSRGHLWMYLQHGIGIGRNSPQR